MNPLSDPWLQAGLTLAGLLIGGGGITAIWRAWREQRREPVEAETAAIASMARVNEGMQALIDRLTGRLDAQEARLSVAETTIEAQGMKLSQLRDRLDRWAAYYRDLAAHWGHYRQGDAPPSPPHL